MQPISTPSPDTSHMAIAIQFTVKAISMEHHATAHPEDPRPCFLIAALQRLSAKTHLALAIRALGA